jgi:hypothetical protein
MKTDIKEKLLKYAEEKEEILSLFYLKSRNSTDEFTEVYTVVNEIIISKMQEELSSIFDNIVLENKKKDFFKIGKKSQQYTILEVFTRNNGKITENIILEEFAEDFIKSLPNDLEYIYDNMELKEKTSGYRYAYNLPKQYEFEECIRSFFALSLEVSYLLVQRDRIAASLKMQNLRKELLRMVDRYIINKFSKTKNSGLDYENISSVLETEYRDLAFETFSSSEILEIYHSLFKSCQLFRKLGLIMAHNLKFNYLKREDVEVLKILRENYKKIESLIY